MSGDPLPLGLKLPESSIHEVCRICLLKSRVLIPIKEVIFTHCLTPNGELENISLCKVLYDYCKVQIFPSDGKPQHICEVCVNMSSKAFNFFQLFVASNNFLEAWYPHLKEVPTDIEIRPEESELHIKVEHQEVIENLGVKDTTTSNITEGNSSFNEIIREKECNLDDSMKGSPKKSFSQFMLDLNVVSSSGNLSKMKQAMKQKDDIFSCKQCDVILHGIDKLIEHDLDSHRLLKGIQEQVTCSICRKICLGIRSYKFHMASHFSNALVCKFCQEYFPSVEECDAHNAAIDHEKVMCRLCGKKFPRQKSNGKYRNEYKCLQHHVEVKHRGIETITCHICGKIFKYLNNLRRHIRVVHKKQKIMCQHCAKPLQTTWQLKIHVERHHPEAIGTDLKEKFPNWFSKNIKGTHVINCPHCSHHFYSFHYFYHHCNEAHNWFTNYVCQVCPEEFPTFEKLLTHQKDHPHHKCGKCGSTFVFSSDLVAHKNKCYEPRVRVKQKPNVHRAHIDKRLGTVRNRLGLTSVKCQFCPKSVRSNYQLYRHSVAHPEFQDYACEVCGNTYANLGDLDRHHKEDHEELCCRECDFYFASKGSLVLHCYKAHRGGKERNKSQCDICGTVISGGKQARAVHMNIHAGVKPFICNICGRGFRQGPNLKMHMYQHATGKEKPWKCRLCPKSFVVPSSLRCHFRTHTGEKPFQCLYCAKTFADPTVRHKHIKKFHPEKEEEYNQLRADGVLRQEVKDFESNAVEDFFDDIARLDKPGDEGLMEVNTGTNFESEEAESAESDEEANEDEIVYNDTSDEESEPLVSNQDDVEFEYE